MATLNDVLLQIKELKERTAVYSLLISILKTRYLTRDTGDALAKISCEGAPVSEAVIEAIITEFEKYIKQTNKAVDMQLKEKL